MVGDVIGWDAPVPSRGIGRRSGSYAVPMPEGHLAVGQAMTP